MDPGTALSVVSLGIEVCKDIAQYYKQWKECPENVASTVRCVESLQKTLTHLGQVLRDRESSKEIRQQVSQCLNACSGGIDRLRQENEKFDDAAQIKKDLKGAVKKAMLRLWYPFKESTLGGLRDTVAELLGQLSLAVQVLDLAESERLHGRSIVALKQARDEIRDVAGKVEAVEDAINVAQATIIDRVSTVEEKLEEFARLVDDRTKETLQAARTQRLEKALAWLNSPVVDVDHFAACKKRAPKTGDWFLASPDYMQWKLSSRSPKEPLDSSDLEVDLIDPPGVQRCVWLHGKPGCCKTVLTSIIVEDLRRFCNGKPHCSLLYFYFTFSDQRKQNYDALLRAIVAQLSQKPSLATVLLNTYYRHFRESPNGATSIALEEILALIMQKLKRVYLIVDALDECPDMAGNRQDMLSSLGRLKRTFDHLRILATSRRLPDIEDAVSTWDAKFIEVNSASVDNDIEIYVNLQLATAPALRRREFQACKELIVEKIGRGADGMFRWAFLQLEGIKKLPVQTKYKIQAALAALPQDLDATYERMLGAVFEGCEDYVARALQWLVFSERLLTLESVAEAMSLDISRLPLISEEDRVPWTSVLNILSAFAVVLPPENHELRITHVPGMTIIPHSKVDNITGDDEVGAETDIQLDRATVAPRSRLRLAHFSVKEYLMSNKIQQGPASRYAMREGASRCYLNRVSLIYLNDYLDSKQEDNNANILDSVPLAVDAARQWYRIDRSSACECGNEDAHVQLELLILGEARRMERWLALHNPRSPDVPTLSMWNATALCYACFLGLAGTVQRLVQQGHNVNPDCNDTTCGTPLTVASKLGHQSIVKLLLLHGADVNGSPGWYGDPLYHAAYHGNMSIVKILLDHRADCDADDLPNMGSALVAASYSGHLDIVKLLLQHGTHVRNPSSSSAIIEAVGKGYIEIVDVLLDSGADINASDRFGRSPILLAAGSGNKSCLRRVLDAGAAVNGRAGNLAMRAAVLDGHADIVDILLLHAVELGSSSHFHYLLEVAIQGKHAGIIAKLIDSRNYEDLAKANSFGVTIFEQAAYTGSIETLQVLLDKISSKLAVCSDVFVFTALDTTSGEEIARLLLESGADIDLAHNSRRSIKEYIHLLTYSLKDQDRSLARTYIYKEIESNIRNASLTLYVPFSVKKILGESSVGDALGRESLKSKLLEEGVDIDFRPEDDRTLLQRIILDLWIPDARNDVSELTDPQLQSLRVDGIPTLSGEGFGYATLTKKLISFGANVNKPLPNGRTLLQAALEARQNAVVTFLCQHAAFTDALSSDEQSLLETLTREVDFIKESAVTTAEGSVFVDRKVGLGLPRVPDHDSNSDNDLDMYENRIIELNTITSELSEID